MSEGCWDIQYVLLNYSNYSVAPCTARMYSRFCKSPPARRNGSTPLVVLLLVLTIFGACKRQQCGYRALAHEVTAKNYRQHFLLAFYLTKKNYVIGSIIAAGSTEEHDRAYD